MTGVERGFLLLTSCLGDPERPVLTQAQLRILAQRIRSSTPPAQDREMQEADLIALGYHEVMANRILLLLSQEDILEHYLYRARQADCLPLTRAGKCYPRQLIARLGDDSPGALWAKGDLSLLDTPCVGLVGSRELREDNWAFAKAAGEQAACQGYTLVSGNARGADRTAQEACLAAGGNVICVVADTLCDHARQDRVLYLSEDSFDAAFSSYRALSRNRVIHALGEKTLVAQANLGRGGTWNGTVRNLKSNWSSVFCFDDGTPAARELHQLGACLITAKQLKNLAALQPDCKSLFI